MSAQTITIELDEGDYNILQQAIQCGDYRNESEAIAHLIPNLLLRDAQPVEAFLELQEAVQDSCYEADHYPERLLTIEEAKEALRRELLPVTEAA